MIICFYCLLWVVFLRFFIWCGGNILWAKRFDNPQLVETLKIFAPYAIFALPLAAISATLVVQDRVKELTIFNIFSRVFLFLCVLTAALVFGNVISLVSAELISAAVVFVVIIVMMYKFVPNDNGSIQRKGMWQMLKYCVPLGLSAMLGTISVQLDQVIVSSMCSPEQYAVYANGTMEIPIIGMITGSIASIILVEMRKSVVEGNTHSALEMFRKAALRSSPILIPVMIFLLCMAKPFIEVIYSSKYVDSIDTFRIYLLMLPARIVYYSSALLAFGLTRVVLFRSALSLMFNAILSIILVHFFGYFGAIISFIIVLYFWDVSYNLKFYQGNLNVNGINYCH